MNEQAQERRRRETGDEELPPRPADDEQQHSWTCVACGESGQAQTPRSLQSAVKDHSQKCPEAAKAREEAAQAAKRANRERQAEQAARRDTRRGP